MYVGKVVMNMMMRSRSGMRMLCCVRDSALSSNLFR
jgi:hypothetical protein